MKEERKDTLLAKNLKVLLKLDRDLWERVSNIKSCPECQVFPAKSGVPTLRVGDSTMHSLYDPEKEAIQWVDHQLSQWDGFSTPTIFGIGLGHHILELHRRLSTTFMVVEPDIKVFRAALEYIDISKLIDKVSFLVAPEEVAIERSIKGCTYIMPHIPTMNLHKDVYMRIGKRIKLSERYKILVVGPIYGGSLPVAGYVVSALSQLGYEVEFADCSLFSKAFQSVGEFTSENSHRSKLREIFINFASEAIMANVVEFKPDLVFALAQAPLTADLLRRLKGHKIPTAFWFVEDFRNMEYWQDVAPFYDYFFTIQDGEFFDALANIGARNYYYLPMAVSPDIHKPMELNEAECSEFSSDVSFVGAGYYNRRTFFPNFIDLDMRIWGNEWEGAHNLSCFLQRQGARVSTEDAVKIFNASNININLHSSKQHKDINPNGDFLNPRTFEIAACGGFQLVDYRSDLPRFFNIGEEIVCFTSTEDAREKIVYYLEHPAERTEIAARAKKRVLKEHTYEKRMEEAMSFIVERGFEGAASIPGRAIVKDLIKEAGFETELGTYLSRFKDKRALVLKDIINNINTGEGSLSKTEALFLMMNEFLQKKEA